MHHRSPQATLRGSGLGDRAGELFGRSRNKGVGFWQPMFVHGLETLPFVSTHVYDTERRVQGQHINGRAGPRLPCDRYAGSLTHTVGVALWPARAARVAWICDRTKAKFGNHGRVEHEGASGASYRASRVFDQICSKIRPAIFQADHATGTDCLCCDGCESTERELLFEKPQSGEGYTAIHVQGTPHFRFAVREVLRHVSRNQIWFQARTATHRSYFRV